ncbi:MAG: pentapeptide repeat-containing protein [Methanosarcinaceae archaeon]
MAIEEHLMIVNSGVIKWNQWREKNPNIKPDLDKIDFIGADLKDINLNNASLKGATLSCSDFSYASLKNVDMSYSTIGSCRFNSADGTGSVLDSTNVIGATFKDAIF